MPRAMQFTFLLLLLSSELYQNLPSFILIDISIPAHLTIQGLLLPCTYI